MIETLREAIAAAMRDNQFLQGGAVLMLFGGALAWLRYVPGAVFAWWRRTFTVSLEVRDRQMVDGLAEWMAETGYGKRCRRVSGFIIHLGEEGHPTPVLEPGLGAHWFLSDGRVFRFTHILEEGNAETLGMRTKAVRIETHGRDNEVLRKIVEKALRAALARRRDHQESYINDSYGHWQRMRGALVPRPIDSVVLPESDKAEIVQDATWYLNAREWHVHRGLPYRRGYLFHGPPGNGKSSLIQALSAHFDLPIYVLAFGEKDFADRHLALAMGNVPARAIVAVEDVDKVKLKKSGGVTMAGLLNAIDGSIATDGRILIFTANDIGKIDPILLRPGRVDRTWEIPAPCRETASAMFLRFFDDQAAAQSFGSIVEQNGYRSMASIQECLVSSGSADEAVGRVQ